MQLFARSPGGLGAEGDNEGKLGGGHIKSPEEKFRKVLVETIIRWGCEAEIESTDLVREMFALLLRQYDTVGTSELNVDFF